MLDIFLFIFSKYQNLVSYHDPKKKKKTIPALKNYPFFKAKILHIDLGVALGIAGITWLCFDAAMNSS